MLRVISSVDPAGGGPIEGLLQSSAVLSGLGHETEILSLDSPDAPWVGECRLPVHATGPRKGKFGYSPNIIPWLEAHQAEYGAIIVHGLWQFHGLAVRNALTRLNRPYYVFTHGMLDPWFKHKYPLKHVKKWLYWPWAEYRVLRDAEKVLFTTEEERLKARESFWLYQCKEHVVNYGTAGHQGDSDDQKRVFFEDYPQLIGKPYLLFLSRIHPKKGIDILIKAFAEQLAKRPELELVIAGPDQIGYQKQMEQLANTLGVDSKITWTGMLQGDCKWGAYLNAEAFVLPSHQENFGIVVAEALSCGLPTLITDKVNIWREVEEDGAGMISNDDVQGFSEILKQWLSRPETEKTIMSVNARNSFQERFEITGAAHSLLAALSSSKAKM